MKKISFLLLVATIVTSCAVGTYYPNAENRFGAQTTVVLDKANFRVVRDVEAVVAVNNTNLSRADVENSAYSELLRNAQLTGSQVLINVVIEEVRREKWGILRALFVGFPQKYQYVAARATIIEFLDDNGEPIPAESNTPEKSLSTEHPDSLQNTNTTSNISNSSETKGKHNIALLQDIKNRTEYLCLKIQDFGWEKSVLGLSYNSAIQQLKKQIRTTDYITNMNKINDVIELVLTKKIFKSVVEQYIRTGVNQGKEEYQLYLEVANQIDKFM